MNIKQMLDELYKDGWGVHVELLSHGWTAVAKKPNRAGVTVFGFSTKERAIAMLYDTVKSQDWRHER